MSQHRVSDLAIMLGHVLQCEECRLKLLADPERAVVGRKIPEQLRIKLSALSEADFENTIKLASIMELDHAELTEGSSHPRARLRHL